MPRAIEIAQGAVNVERQSQIARSEQEVLLREERERTRAYSVHETVLAAEKLLERPEWFPGVEWKIVDDNSSIGAATGFSGTGQDVVFMDEQDPQSSPLKLHVHRCTDDSGPALTVHLVRLDRDSGTQYNYWHGPEVKSALDVGKALERRTP